MISEAWVRGAKPAQKTYRLTDARGLYLQVTPTGGRYWRFNYRFDGKQKTLALGTYPDVPLAKARERLEEARQLIADVEDPGAVKQAISQDFETVARAWLAHRRTGPPAESRWLSHQ
jgi:Arm DNA-binding domain